MVIMGGEIVLWVTETFYVCFWSFVIVCMTLFCSNGEKSKVDFLRLF